ncbi:MAG: sulfate/molybdate ABC transporter ATP-binding protein [Oscillospiraceae bacterium]
MSLYVDIEKRLGAFRLQSKFEVADETLALLGASGCGKSVTLKCIAGIMTPDRGRIVLNGRVLFDSEKRTDLTPQQRRVGYLFQQYALFPNMTVEQNILCGIRAGSRSEKRALAAEKLRMFRLEGLEKKYPAQLSGGQQQRVALARILCPSRRRSCSTSPSPRSTATSSGTSSWSSPTCSRAFAARSSGSATTRGNAAATAKRSA